MHALKFQRIDMNVEIRNLISPWLHMKSLNSIISKDSIRILHPVEIVDHFFNSIFPGDIKYYSTAFIGKVRFTTSRYARNKVSDDSSIIFKVNQEESFGRIRRIFTVNDENPIFYVDVISDNVNFQCKTTNST